MNPAATLQVSPRTPARWPKSYWILPPSPRDSQTQHPPHRRIPGPGPGDPTDPGRGIFNAEIPSPDKDFDSVDLDGDWECEFVTIQMILIDGSQLPMLIFKWKTIYSITQEEQYIRFKGKVLSYSKPFFSEENIFSHNFFYLSYALKSIKWFYNSDIFT